MLFNRLPSRPRATRSALRLVRWAGADREGDFPMPALHYFGRLSGDPNR